MHPGTAEQRTLCPTHHQSLDSPALEKGWLLWPLAAGIWWGSAEPLKSCWSQPGGQACCHSCQRAMGRHQHAATALCGKAAAWWLPGAMRSAYKGKSKTSNWILMSRHLHNFLRTRKKQDYLGDVTNGKANLKGIQNKEASWLEKAEQV